MPELPEVETIRRGLHPVLVGRRIETLWRSGIPLRRDRLGAGLEGRRCTNVARHGKFLLVGLDDGSTLSVHLGMTGKLLVDPAPRPHTHLVLGLDDGTRITYSDPRRFGMLVHHPPGPVADLAHYGPDALDPDLSAAAFDARLSGSRAPLKAFLLDQTKLAGVGNIYACEALWRAGLSPRRRACNTPRARRDLLLASVRAVLLESIEKGGTSFNDYVDTIGRPGRFLLDVAVFGRSGLPCLRCRAPIRRIGQAGRSTFYCPRCQR